MVLNTVSVIIDFNNSRAQSWGSVIVADITLPNHHSNASGCHRNATRSVYNAKDE